MIGIYKLEFESSFYIGQSLNIERRFNSHIWMLKNNLHSNNKMQKLFNNTNKLPKLVVLEECNSEKLNVLEKYYINKYNATTDGLNILNDSIINMFGEDHPTAIYSNKQILEIFKEILLNELSLKCIAEKYCVDKGLVYSIASGINHSWIKEIYPKDYIKMLELKYIRSNGKTAKDQGIKYPLIKSPNGEIFEVTNLNQFAEEHNINKSSLCQLLNGKRKSANKFKLA